MYVSVLHRPPTIPLVSPRGVVDCTRHSRERSQFSVDLHFLQPQPFHVLDGPTNITLTRLKDAATTAFAERNNVSEFDELSK